MSDWEKTKIEATIPIKTAWQPIETAPRDGTEVILFWRGTSFVGEYRLWMRGDPHQTVERMWRSSCCGRIANPTHWMPLPPPPKEDGKP